MYLTFLAAIVAMQVAAAGPRIGVAAASSEGQICLAMPGPALPSGAAVTLIRPDPRQSVVVATVDRPVPQCERLEQSSISGPYYLVRRPTVAASDSSHVWVVALGRLTTRRNSSGGIVVQLSAAYQHAQVRACTSREGLHLTVWAGTPLKSRRLWHEYYYLGYDVEPSCRDEEVGAAAG